MSNTTPLINLVGVGLLDLLPGLYGAVQIPQEVRDEYQAGVKPGEPDLDGLAWLKIVPAAARDTSLPARLGAGEAAAISLALAEHARAILLDEAYARRIVFHNGGDYAAFARLLRQAALRSEMRLLAWCLPLPPGPLTASG